MDWRFARELKWLVRHAAVVVLVAAMVAAGFWQLRRLDEKQAYKALVEQRQEEPAAPVGQLLDPADTPGDAAVDDVLYRSVSAIGAYVDDDTVVVENRTLNGASGAWVLTPLQLPDGTAVVVNRGFLGFDRDGEIVPPPAPTGDVTVEGLLLPSQERGRFGPTDPVGERLEVLARADLERFEQQLDFDLLPAYVQLVTSDPAEAPAAADAPQLVALGPPELSEGPHLAYAVQWFIFTTIAAVGYAVLLRRVARERGKAAAHDEAVDRELAGLLHPER